MQAPCNGAASVESGADHDGRLDTRQATASTSGEAEFDSPTDRGYRSGADASARRGGAGTETGASVNPPQGGPFPGPLSDLDEPVDVDHRVQAPRRCVNDPFRGKILGP